MSDKIQMIANVYTKVVKNAAGDPGVARTTMVLVPDGAGGLKPEERVMAGPRVRVGLMGSRDLMITDLGAVCVATHRNNPNAAKHPWLTLMPVWGKIPDPNGGTVDVLKGILDERGGKVNFVLLDDQLEG